ncbi:hypothetical protein [Nocardiopsis sp. CNT-189]|uniref:hypothetical protein n=1 Tax=Nocardiopsis oceanisediminis TaxID=2816862 RepID=UPI003B3BC9EB
MEIVRHGVPYLGEIPEYGDDLERVWAEGQEKPRGLSERSRPGTAVEAVRRVADQAAQG